MPGCENISITTRHYFRLINMRDLSTVSSFGQKKGDKLSLSPRVLRPLIVLVVKRSIQTYTHLGAFF